MTVKVLYFAWLRTQRGVQEEDLDPPAGVATVADLIEWLAELSPKHAQALANRTVVRVAVNQEYVGRDHRLKAGDEVALFPPVTGG